MVQCKAAAVRALLGAATACMMACATGARAERVRAREWVNLTVYHVNQANYSAGDIGNMNTADTLGDLEFTVRAKVIPMECSTPGVRAPWDCANPEQDATNLAISKVVVTVDKSMIGAYCPCNVHEGVYTCTSPNWVHPGPCPSGFGAIPVGKFLSNVANFSKFNASTPRFEYYNANVLDRFGAGMWYNSQTASECTADELRADEVSVGADGADGGAPCSWRVAKVVKRVSRACSNKVQEKVVYSAGQACFNKCPQPTNQKSDCWVDCYFTTVLGRDAGHAKARPSDGIPVADIVAAWEAPFRSDDPAKGGCPAV